MTDSMDIVFVALFAAYLALAIYTVRRDTLPKPAADRRVMALQVPVMIVAIIVTWQHGFLGRELLAAWFVAGGLLLGYVTFAASLVMTKGGGAHGEFFEELYRYFTGWRARGEYLAEHPREVHLILMGSAAEELMYRAAGQTALAQWWGPVPALLVIALLFAVAHRHFLRNARRESFEFLLFSLFLGVLFHVTQSLTLLVIVHAVRNFEIAFLEYLTTEDEAEGGIPPIGEGRPQEAQP